MRYLSPNMNSPPAIIIQVFLFTAFYLQIANILGTFNLHLFIRTISYVVGSVRICQRVDYHICDSRLLLLVLPVPTTGQAVQHQVPLGEAGNDLLLVIAAHVNIHQKQICMEMPCQ